MYCYTAIAIAMVSLPVYSIDIIEFEHACLAANNITAFNDCYNIKYTKEFSNWKVTSEACKSKLYGKGKFDVKLDHYSKCLDQVIAGEITSSSSMLIPATIVAASTFGYMML